MTSCSFSSSDSPRVSVTQKPTTPITEVVVLPHHGITGKRIDAFYADLKKQYASFDKIIIISPDHFGVLQHGIESLPTGLKTICYQSVCVPGGGLDPYSRDTQVGYLFSHDGVTHEHGLGEHIFRIARYFPDATVIPIVVKRKLKSGQEEIQIGKTLGASGVNTRMLIITSVDFSHHVKEDFAVMHDIKSIDTLSYGGISDFDSLEVDCRNCLSVAKEAAKQIGKPFFVPLARTSVVTLFGTGNDIDNTSHMFGKFSTSSKEALAGSGVFLFGGDSHWARGFTYYDKKDESYRKKVVQILYQQYDSSKDLVRYYHRVFSGFDEVVLNLESGIGTMKECPKSGKETQMRTDPSEISWFHALGISLVNIANNHSHDCGRKVFEQEKEYLFSGSIQSFGYDDIFAETIRGNHFAFIGVDTIESTADWTGVLDTIRSMTSSGYLVILNVHWGKEYESVHSPRQGKIAHDAIDAGARLIIGHHPHVIQDSEIYKGIPIYYSLGNFLFDQPFPETLKGLLVGCEVSRVATNCREVPVYRDPKNYVLHF